MVNTSPPNQNESATSTGLEFLKTLGKTQTDVWLLLHYAVSDANKDIKVSRPDLIEKCLPGLKKKPEELTEVEIANLLSAYNELSQLVYPATVESLWLKQQIEDDERQSVLGGIDEPSWWKSMFCLRRHRGGGGTIANGNKKFESAGQQVKNNTSKMKWLLYGFGGIIIILQAYTFFLSYELEAVDKQKAALEGVEKEIFSASAGIKAGGGEPDSSDVKSRYPLKGYNAKKQEILLSLNGNYCALRRASYYVWGWMYSDKVIDCELAKATEQLATKTEQLSTATNTLALNTPEVAKQMGRVDTQPGYVQNQQGEVGKQQAEAAKLLADIEESQANATRESFFAGATAVQRILNYLLLPTLLGSLGALAYVIRDLLKNYAEASYVIGSSRNRSMRIVLGPLLGLISGIIAYPSRDAFTEATFSPLIFGFLMGYSVEFAFSLFDTLIAKGKSMLPEIIIPPKQAAGTATGVAPVPQVFKLDPIQGAVAGGEPITIIGSGFTKDATVKFGSNVASVSKVEETQITAVVPPGQGTVNVTVQTQGGSSLSRPESQYTYLSESSGEPEDEHDNHACDAGVQNDAETSDEELPAAQ